MAEDYIQEFKAAVPKVIAKAWSDPAFESLLLSNTAKAFAQYGVVLPNTLDLRVVKHADAQPGGWVITESGGRQVMTLPLPPQGAGGGAASAAAACSSSTCCTA